MHAWHHSELSPHPLGEGRLGLYIPVSVFLFITSLCFPVPCDSTGAQCLLSEQWPLVHPAHDSPCTKTPERTPPTFRSLADFLALGRLFPRKKSAPHGLSEKVMLSTHLQTLLLTLLPCIFHCDPFTCVLCHWLGSSPFMNT